MLDKFNECPLQILGYIQTVNGSSIDIDRRIGAFFTPICYALWCTHDLSISTYNDIQLYFHFQSRVGNHRSQTHTRCDQYRWKAVVFPEMEIVLMTYLSLAAPRVAKIIMSIFPFQYLLIMLLNPPNSIPISQIKQCIRHMSHDAPFCNRNVHTCAHFCYKMVQYGILSNALWDLGEGSIAAPPRKGPGLF